MSKKLNSHSLEVHSDCIILTPTFNEGDWHSAVKPPILVGLAIMFASVAAYFSVGYPWYYLAAAVVLGIYTISQGVINMGINLMHGCEFQFDEDGVMYGSDFFPQEDYDLEDVDLSIVPHKDGFALVVTCGADNVMLSFMSKNRYECVDVKNEIEELIKELLTD
tara:strand:- start:1918 stop:2409 length:492 start_codon:yes stop_codon:yes gene_type:complete